ncbi:RNA polymerase sigma factor [Opitutaceae bacterium EW11]|nr:RNA polymerase sigma factor [Opitutaceae bacterium EW11]
MVRSPDSIPVPSEIETSDHELMLAVRDGQVARLGELFERHHGPLYGFFVRLTGQRTLSEDLVQQVFYRILKYRHTYRDEGKFSAWMYHLGRRVAADHYRKHRTGETVDREEVNLEHIPDDAMDSGEQAEKNDDLALMQKAFAELPLDQREILTLHRFQHLPHSDIARLLDCSVGAAKVRLHRAVNALRDSYFRMRRHDGAR